MTHFFNNKQVLMENVSFQDLTPKLFSEKQIDQMVYKLYDLTEEEIKILEGKK